MVQCLYSGGGAAAAGGIVSIVGGNIAHTSQSYIDTGISSYILTILTFLIDTIELWIDMYNLCI